MTKPPRDLRGSLADLEALMGNAVLLENTSLAPEWQCPESYAAAMCVPIGSPTMPHGTLWLWSDHVRDFSSADIDAAKAAGDKILVDIERSVLADEVLKTRAQSPSRVGQLGTIIACPARSHCMTTTRSVVGLSKVKPWVATFILGPSIANG
ncbi:MAG: hypothetical protein R3C56_23185 [Pirellulaceae bacterium]